ncbi:hypothetical protein BSIN_4005 [Burkholderia singularis]|uniref:Uncharacterized protein n=1 Tax=Burkholderia singularis TaxID=1503053 RepID=A0A238H744_9BURK|nr:hypothetical protein BSIN_4005 [Burkholderia singularis]
MNRQIHSENRLMIRAHFNESSIAHSMVFNPVIEMLKISLTKWAE